MTEERVNGAVGPADSVADEPAVEAYPHDAEAVEEVPVVDALPEAPVVDASPQDPVVDASPEAPAGDTPPEAPAVEGGDLDGEAEVVDGVPVLAEVRAVERPAPSTLPAVQAAAAAGAGFLAGAATMVLVKRRAARKAARQVRAGSRRPADILPIAATRSFLVDVHVIARPTTD